VCFWYTPKEGFREDTLCALYNTEKCTEKIESVKSMKNLFVPLKKEYFFAFRDGTKDTEYRIAGKQWNSKTCIIGRKVTLSLGYGNKQRIIMQIKSYEEKASELFGDDSDVVKCYGRKKLKDKNIAIVKLRECTF
jgi:hypothetical protein